MFNPLDLILLHKAKKGGGGSKPTGTISITENGEYDVTNYANADVDVPAGIVPTGTASILSNGIWDVAQYEFADVSVPLPSGTKNITQNGTVNVYAYQYANVNVPSTPPHLGKIVVQYNATISSGYSVGCRGSLEIANDCVKSKTTYFTQNTSYELYGTVGGATYVGGSAVLCFQELNRSASTLNFSATNGTIKILYEEATPQMYLTYMEVNSTGGGYNNYVRIEVTDK